MRFIFGMIFSLFWASAFIAGKLTLQFLPPLDMLSLRFLLAAIFIFILYTVLPKHYLKHTIWNKWLWIHGLILGLFNYALYLGFSYTGLQTVSPELVVLLISLMPFITTFVLSCKTKQWSGWQWLAIILGLSGVYLVLSARMPEIKWTLGIIWTLLGMLALASGTLFYQFTAHQHPILLLIGIQNLFGGLLLLPFAQPLGWWAALHYHVFALAVWYQVIFVSLIAMLMWFQLVRWFGSANASVFHLLNPIFATLLTWYFFHISLGWLDILGTLLVILALGILNFHRQFKQSRFH